MVKSGNITTEMKHIQLRLITKLFLIALFFFTSGFVPINTTTQDLNVSNDLRKHKLISINPGHGGHDSGAVGSSGLTEKDLTLTLAKRLKQILTQTYDVYLTREGDYWLAIERRTALANHHRCDILINLHASGSFHRTARGISVFYFGYIAGQGLTIQPRKDFTQSEYSLLPWNHVQSTHIDESKLLASLIHAKLIGGTSSTDRGIHRAPLSVLSGADMPAILIEIGYVSHPTEERNLKNTEVISDLARLITEGINEYFRQISSCIKSEEMIEEDIGSGRGAVW